MDSVQSSEKVELHLQLKLVSGGLDKQLGDRSTSTGHDDIWHLATEMGRRLVQSANRSFLVRDIGADPVELLLRWVLASSGSLLIKSRKDQKSRSIHSFVKRRLDTTETQEWRILPSSTRQSP